MYKDIVPWFLVVLSLFASVIFFIIGGKEGIVGSGMVGTAGIVLLYFMYKEYKNKD